MGLSCESRWWNAVGNGKGLGNSFVAMFHFKEERKEQTDHNTVVTVEKIIVFYNFVKVFFGNTIHIIFMTVVFIFI